MSENDTIKSIRERMLRYRGVKYSFVKGMRYAHDVEILLGELADSSAEIDRLTGELEKANEWIPASEPPKQNGTYQCTVQYHYDGKQHPHITILDYATKLSDVDNYDFKGKKCGGFYDYSSETGYFEWKNVSHWRPLPAPPQGKDGE